MNGEKAAYATPTFSNRRQRTLDSLITRLLQDHMHEVNTLLHLRSHLKVCFTSLTEHRSTLRGWARTGLTGPMQGSLPTHSDDPLQTYTRGGNQSPREETFHRKSESQQQDNTTHIWRRLGDLNPERHWWEANAHPLYPPVPQLSLLPPFSPSPPGLSGISVFLGLFIAETRCTKIVERRVGFISR